MFAALPESIVTADFFDPAVWEYIVFHDWPEVYGYDLMVMVLSLWVPWF